MTQREAEAETKMIFGESSFTECEVDGEVFKYYVGAIPKDPGRYEGYMGFSWDQALEFARNGINHA